MEFFTWIENTWLSTTLRDSSNVFVYPAVLAFHTLGLAFLVGISSMISLRILGVAPSVRLAPLKKFFPIMWVGFWVNATSGALLLIIDPARFLMMLDFYVKLLAIAGAVISMRLLYTRRFRHPAIVDPAPLPTSDRRLAGTVLILWGVAVTAGRLTAYDDPDVQRQTAIATLGVTVVLLVVGFVVVRLFPWLRSALSGHADVATPHRGSTLQ